MKTTYPICKRSQYHFYKFYSAQKYLEIFLGYDEFRVQLHNYTEIIPEINDLNECLEAEFLAVYYDVRKKLDDLSLIQL